MSHTFTCFCAPRSIRASAILFIGLAPVSTSFASDESAFAFVDSQQRLGDLLTTVVELADIDNDGDLDAIAPSYLGPAAVWVNRGDGVMIEAADRITPVFLCFDVELADFNGDGSVDLLAVNLSLDSVLFLNDGSGRFVPFQTLPFSDNGAAVASGDLDGDGDLDAMIGSMNGNTNAPAFNDGTGRLTLAPGAGGPTSNSIALGDLDGDGDLDAFLAIGSIRHFANRVLFNDGSGTFTDSGQRLGDELSVAARLGDLDGDGDLDAFVINAPFDGHDAADMVWLNDGAGRFTDSGQRLGEEHSRDLDLADFDFDGDLDALVSAPFSPNLVRLNDGVGNFLSAVEVDPAETDFLTVAVGDLDGDGDLDLFTARQMVGADRVYFGAPSGGTRLTGLEIVTGTLRGGGAAELCTSDDSYVHTRSGFGQTLVDLHNMTMVISATTTVDSPSTMDLAFETRLNQPAGLAQVLVFNYNQTDFDFVGQFALGDTDAINEIAGIDATDYVSAQGEMQVMIKHLVFVPFLAFQFESFVDHVSISLTK